MGMREDSTMSISCSLQDELELLAMHRQVCEIAWRDDRDHDHEYSGRIIDIFARNGQDWLRLEPGEEVLLASLLRVNELRF